MEHGPHTLILHMLTPLEKKEKKKSRKTKTKKNEQKAAWAVALSPDLFVC